MLLRRFVFPTIDYHDKASISTSSKERTAATDDEPIHILMIAVKADKTANTDEELSKKFLEFCNAKVSTHRSFQNNLTSILKSYSGSSKRKL